MLQPEQIKRVRQSFARIQMQPIAFTKDFYLRLFAIAPEVRHMFQPDITPQAEKLSITLIVVINGLEHFQTLVPTLQELGRKHAGYGATEAHYSAVGQALLATLAANSPDWTAEDETAWGSLYGVIAEVMIDAAREASAA